VNGAFYPCSVKYLKFVDEVLGLPVSLYSMADFVPPIPLPKIRDFPGVGYWSPQRIAEAKQVLAPEDPTTRQESFAHLEEVEYLVEAYQTLREWILGSQDGEMIVGF